MLQVNYEFRKGIFFLRLIGELKQNCYQEEEQLINDLLKINKFKYIVINTNYLEKIDIEGINYILKICYLTKKWGSNLVLCDKSRILKKLFNYNIPNIDSELEVL